MRILKTYEDAFIVAEKCLNEISFIKRPSLDGMKKMPEEIDGPWSLTITSAENTLKYIFEKLHHSCYMLCVTNQIPELIKLESGKTAPSFLPEFKKRLNKTLKSKQRKTLLKTLKSKQVRVMQCIVKPYKDQSTVTEDYPLLFEGMQFPNGVFIFNLTDAVILRKDGTEPWQMITGPKPLGEYNFDSHIPILSCSGQQGYWDIPIPNYDDVRYVLGKEPMGNINKIWETKKNVAVFRGNPTGCGYTEETNMRLKLATMRSPDLDVGIIKNKSESWRFDPLYGLGQLHTSIKTVSFMNMEEQSNHKFIIHVDGNVAAYRLLKTMLTGSLILRVKSDYSLWADTILKEGVHYISVNADLSNLQESIEWCKTHDSKCKKIAEQGRQIAEILLTKKYIQDSISRILWSFK